jgi:hypothetical protein
MSKAKTIALGVFSIVTVLGASIGIQASAAEIPLPKFTVETGLSGPFGKSRLNVAGAEIKSPDGDLDLPEATSKRSGKASFWFKESVLAGAQCHSAGDTAGNILLPVIWHLVPPFREGTSAAIMFEIPNTIEVKCTVTDLHILSGVSGVDKITPTDKLTGEFKVYELLSYFFNNNGEAVYPELRIEDGGKQFRGNWETETLELAAETETELVEK